MEPPLDVTVLVPVHDEEDNVVELVERIDRVLRRTGRSYEILFVDDGSKDRTAQRLAEAAERVSALRVVRLRRNFGQTAALAAGFDRARGRYIVTMDGDLQNDPEDVPTILSLLDEGFDLVSGWRRDRKDAWLTRRLPSMVANRLLSAWTGVRIHDFGCTLKGYRASFAKAVPVYSEMHRYMPALAGSLGARVTEVVVRHHPRRHGRSKYGIGRTFRVLYDMIALRMLTRFSQRPLHWFGVWSLPCFLAAMVLGPLAYVDHRAVRLIESSTIVFPTIVVLLVYLGFYLLVLGLLAELALHVLRPGQRLVLREERAAAGGAP